MAQDQSNTSNDDDYGAGDDSDDNLNFSLELESSSPFQNYFKQTNKEKIFLWLGSLEGALITTLPLPKSDAGTAAKYVVTADKEVMELQRIKVSPSSWFIDQSVKEDGSLYVTTPIDPLFLLIPRLNKLREKGSFVPVEAVFIDSEYPGYRHLKDCKNLHFESICDIEKVGNEQFIRLNDEKLILWLKEKVRAICDYLVSASETISMAIPLVKSQVEGFKQSSAETLTKGQQLSIAIGLLSEYIPSVFLQKLKECYPELSEVKASFVAPLDTETPSNSRKRMSSSADDIDSDLNYIHADNVTPKKKARKSLAQAQLEKVDTKKIPKITSFFASPNRK